MTIDNKALLNSMAAKYELAEKLVFAKLKPWQKEAITQDRASGHETGLLHQFCQDVIRTAENMVIAPPTAKPPVVHTSGAVQWPTASQATPEWESNNKHNGANGYDEDDDIFS